MKRVITFAILIVMMLSVLSICAFAAPALNENEQKIFDAYTKTVTVAGKEIKLDAEWVNLGKNYMLREDVDITAEQAEKILGYIAEAEKVAKTAKTATEATAFGAEINNKIIDLAAKAAAVVELKTVVANDHVTFIDAADKVVAEADATIKATGAENNVMPVVVLAVLAMLTVAGAVCVRKIEF